MTYPHIFVPDAAPAALQQKFLDATINLPFVYKTNTAYSDKGPFITDEVYDVGQCVSLLNKDWESLTRELLDNLKPHIPDNYKIHRAKLNLMWRCKEAGTRWNSPHTDNPNQGVLAVVYYLNDTDGDTVIFYDNEIVRVKPVKGAALILPANRLHASSHPTEALDRLVLNIVVSEKQPF